MRFVTKNMLGIYTESDNHTEVLMTAEEYEKELNDYKQLLHKFNSLQATANKLKKDLNENIEKNRILEETSNEYSEKKAIFEEIKNNNEKYRRIFKQRRASKEGLTPVKKHSGYVLIGGKPVMHRTSDERAAHEPAYQYTFETPYEIYSNLNCEKLILTSVIADFKQFFSSEMLLFENSNENFDKKSIKFSKNVTKSQIRTRNCVLLFDFQAMYNPKSNCFNIQIKSSDFLNISRSFLKTNKE
ncbi:MAG: hypothetical protein R3Y09_11900 [Clostridia bacterium]